MTIERAQEIIKQLPQLVEDKNWKQIMELFFEWDESSLNNEAMMNLLPADFWKYLRRNSPKSKKK